MKYLPVPDFDELNAALTFDTSDCNVTGACELYSTKSTGADKKLLRQIDSDLSTRHDELVQLSKSLPPPESADFVATSPNMRMFTKDSAFGPLRETANRRTYGYLIATLNASHPHYEFSNCLRPEDFEKLRDASHVAADIDANLHRFRHSTLGRDEDGAVVGPEDAQNAAWGPRCWAILDGEIRLAECDIFRYSPESDPFKDDEGAVWSARYLFFNREEKRVVYLYARMVPVLSSRSPPSQPVVGSLKRSIAGVATSSSGGAHKRARFWLGDTDPSLIEIADPDDEDDGFCWNRAEDGHMMAEDESYYSLPAAADDDTSSLTSGGEAYDVEDDDHDHDEPNPFEPGHFQGDDMVYRMEMEI